MLDVEGVQRVGTPMSRARRGIEKREKKAAVVVVVVVLVVITATDKDEGRAMVMSKPAGRQTVGTR
jgi:hypothetical protein